MDFFEVYKLNKEPMNYSQYLNIIEKLNSDYLDLINSREYNLGRRWMKVIRYFKTKQYVELLNLVKRTKIRKYANEKNNAAGVFKTKTTNTWFPESGAKCEVYTCIAGGYDTWKLPIVEPDGVSYTLFTDSLYHMDSMSRIINVNNVVDSEVMEMGDLYKNRYCKMHPFELFPDADYSLYIDGNVQIVSDIRPMLRMASESQCGIAMHSHVARSCIYKEAEACIAMGKGDKFAIENQIEKYKSKGFPKDFGLFEATVIAVDLNNQTAKLILDRWWEEYCLFRKSRDQISFPYVLWKCGYEFTDIGCLGTNVKRNPKFRVLMHAS